MPPGIDQCGIAGMRTIVGRHRPPRRRAHRGCRLVGAPYGPLTGHARMAIEGITQPVPEHVADGRRLIGSCRHQRRCQETVDLSQSADDEQASSPLRHTVERRIDFCLREAVADLYEHFPGFPPCLRSRGLRNVFHAKP